LPTIVAKGAFRPQKTQPVAIESDVVIFSSLFKGRPGGIFGGEKFASDTQPTKIPLGPPFSKGEANQMQATSLRIGPAATGNAPKYPG
jgi:hypothetical protein